MLSRIEFAAGAVAVHRLSLRMPLRHQGSSTLPRIVKGPEHHARQLQRRSVADDRLQPGLGPEPKLSDYVVFRDADVGQLLREKRPSSEVLGISPDETVFAAVDKMNRENVGALVVLGGAGELVGIVTERDYLGKVVLCGLSSKTSRVKDIMTPNPVTVGASAKAGECMALMTAKRFRHLPVLDSRGLLVGMISIGDLVKYVIDQQKLTIDFLREYIAGTY